MSLFDGFADGFRQGRETAIAARKEEVRAWKSQAARGGCRVHGERYPGCPLDLIERRPAPPVDGRRALPDARIR